MNFAFNLHFRSHYFHIPFTSVSRGLPILQSICNQWEHSGAYFGDTTHIHHRVWAQKKQENGWCIASLGVYTNCVCVFLSSAHIHQKMVYTCHFLIFSKPKTGGIYTNCCIFISQLFHIFFNILRFTYFEGSQHNKAIPIWHHFLALGGADSFPICE